MTHTRRMAEHEGDLNKPEPSSQPCPKCEARHVFYQTWESSDGAYEDYKYTCPDCGFVWWVDGIDS